MNRSAVIFDFDGTITRPLLDFDAIRAEIGVAHGPVLEALEMMDAATRSRAEAILERHEWEAARHATLQEGAVDVLAACRAKGHPVAILTRNTHATLDYVLGKFGVVVDAARTREDEPIKPSPEPVLSICKELSAEPRHSWVVGDYLFDILSGKLAGAKTVLMINDRDAPHFADQADHVIRRLRELLPIIEAGVGREA